MPNPRENTVQELFEEQVDKDPYAPAVVFESTQLTYNELNSRTNQLAHHLRALGAGPEISVRVCPERLGVSPRKI